MEKLREEEIEALGRKTALRLSNRELAEFQEHVRELSEYLTKLEEVALPRGEQRPEDGYWMHKNKTPLRKDCPKEFDQRELLRRNFPNRKGDHAVVAKVVK